jgi:hypothetical protein
MTDKIASHLSRHIVVVIITILGYLLIELADNRIQNKIESGQQLSKVEMIILEYVNPAINFLHRVAPFTIISLLISIYGFGSGNGLANIAGNLISQNIAPV